MPAAPPRLAAVCLPLPVRTTFTYAVPEELAEGLVPGRRVRVPFGPRTMAGWCVGRAEPPEPGEDGKAVEPKPILALLDDGPLLPPELLGLSRWIADTYACSWGEALSACVPSGVRKETAEATVARARLVLPADEARVLSAKLLEKHPKRSRVLRILSEHAEGLAVRDLVRAAQCGDSPVRTLAKQGSIAIDERLLPHDPFAGAQPEPQGSVVLSRPQEAALAALFPAIDGGAARTFLLQGVTGSGKTEVYLRAIERVVARGRQAIVLVPEISLTPQTVARFRGWFRRVAVLHSALTEAERRRQWKDIRAGRADVVIGPRSAVFAPLPDLGLVVVDEEHEPSFKQQSAPRYHARDVAVERARRRGAVAVLGSATPSLETAWEAREGRVERLLLPARVGAGTLPRIEIVDMVEEARETGRISLLGRRLAGLLGKALDARKQAILFLNRRGFAAALFCGRCGTTLTCPRCSTSRTLHRAHGTVLCHHCGDEAPVPRTCPGCGAPGLARVGVGTERLEEVVRAIHPGVRVERMDTDSMHDRASYERVLGAFGRGEVDVLVGTQMIAKGLHFPGVVLVGVVSADLSLQVPDFRAAERTFQLVAQVAGRAGRADAAGRVVVQTLQPRHPAIVRAAAHDYDAFAAAETEERRRFGWPPATRLVRALVTARDAAAARRRASEVAGAAAAALPPGGGDVLGPSPCPVAKLRDRWRFHAVVRAADRAVQHAVCLRLQRFSHRAGGTELVLDVDPADLT